MIEKIKHFIHEKNLLKEGDKVMIGLSGGADSVCLLLVLKELLGEKSLLALHVNHGIRGEEAKRDEAFVRELCEREGIELLVKRADIPLFAKERGLGLEEAGRRVRYDFFYEEREKRGFDKIAVAHHRQDAVETFFINLARGSALTGLTGIKEKNGVLIRPLLPVTREEILRFLQERGRSFVTDSSNLENTYIRNVIRNGILPIFEDKVNKAFASHVMETMGFLREADEFIKEEALNKRELYVKEEEGEVFIREEVLTLPKPLYKTILYKELSELAASRKDIGLLHVKSLEELFKKESGKEVSLPYGLRAEKTYGGLLLKREKEIKKPLPTMEILIFDLPEIKSVKREKSFILLDFLEGGGKKLDESGCVRWFDYDRITENPVVRKRREGDYLIISPDGRKKKLKKYFIDEKIPRAKRDELPLVASGREILWIPGKRTGEGARINSKTKKLLKITIKNMEDLGNECAD